MSVLILTCSTGGGHNSSSDAVKQEFEKNGIHCDIRDILAFPSSSLPKFVSESFSNLYRYFPSVFKYGYKFSEDHPAVLGDKSLLHKIILSASKKLLSLVEENHYDTILSMHIFAATMVSLIKNQLPKDIKTGFVATDYTCYPMTNSTLMDWYFIPDILVKKDFIAAGLPEEKLVDSGIPVRLEFYTCIEKDEAKRQVGIDPRHKHLLMMFGSMGCGPMEKLLALIVDQMDLESEVTVVCGTNKNLYDSLSSQYYEASNVHILGFTDNISVLMDSADLYMTKPGGLSSTEAAVKCLPMLLVNAVAGCEQYNFEFFQEMGAAVSAEDTIETAQLAVSLLKEPEELKKMSQNLRNHPRHISPEIIYQTLK